MVRLLGRDRGELAGWSVNDLHGGRFNLHALKVGLDMALGGGLGGTTRLWLYRTAGRVESTTIAPRDEAAVTAALAELAPRRSS